MTVGLFSNFISPKTRKGLSCTIAIRLHQETITCPVWLIAVAVSESKLPGLAVVMRIRNCLCLVTFMVTARYLIDLLNGPLP